LSDSIYISNSTFVSDTNSSIGLSTVFTPSGSQYTMIKKQGKNQIGPRLFFQYVKSKLTPIETKKHQTQITKLTKLMLKADVIGQFGLSDELGMQLATCVRELEAKACGIEFSIQRDVVRKYIHDVKDVKLIWHFLNLRSPLLL